MKVVTLYIIIHLYRVVITAQTSSSIQMQAGGKQHISIMQQTHLPGMSTYTYNI